MFLQRTTSKKKGVVYESFLVRESFRTAKGPRSRLVANITDMAPELRTLIGAWLKGKAVAEVERIDLDRAASYGGLAVLKEAWERFGLDQFCADLPKRTRSLLQAMIFARILFPESKLGLAREAQGTLLAQACNLSPDETFSEDDLYRAMDGLSERWVATEKQLYDKAFQTPPTLVLYDLTSVYFEGDGPESMSQFGYSRDHRNDRQQIILAVATDAEGIPLHLEVLRGNRADTTTLKGLLATLQSRFGLKKAVFVFDGGMSSQMNLEHLEAEQLHYVTRLSSTTLGNLLKTLPADQQMMLGDHDNLIETEHEGRRYVIAGGTWRADRDKERRTVRLERAEAELNRLSAIPRKKVNTQQLASQVGRTLQRLKAHQYFTYHIEETTGQIQWQRNSLLIDKEAQTDGWYLLHTSLPADKAPAAQVQGHYKNLLRVEDAFRQLKTHLEVRPVYHHRPDRVRNHVRICFIAYWIIARLRQEWNQAHDTGTVTTFLRELQSIRLGTLSIQGKPVRHLLTVVPPQINARLEQLNLLHLFTSTPSWAAL